MAGGLTFSQDLPSSHLSSVFYRTMFITKTLHPFFSDMSTLVVITYSKSSRTSTSSCRVFSEMDKKISNLSSKMKIVLFWIQSWKEHISLSRSCSMLPVPSSSLKFGTLNLKQVNVDGFKLSRNILNMRILGEKKTNNSVPLYVWVALEQEHCLPSSSEHIQLIVSRLGLPSDYWLAEYSQIIPLVYTRYRSRIIWRHKS